MVCFRMKLVSKVLCGEGFKILFINIIEGLNKVECLIDRFWVRKFNYYKDICIFCYNFYIFILNEFIRSLFFY